MPRLPKGIINRAKWRGGRTAYYTRIPGADGKRRWHALGDNLADAEQKLEEIRKGAAPLGSATSVRDLAKRWLSVYVATKRTPRNRVNTKNRTERHLIPYFGRKLARDVTEDDLRLYRVHLEAKELEPSTVRCYLADAVCMFRYAHSSKAITVLPYSDRSGLLPVLQEEKPKRLTTDEVERAIALPEPLGFTVRLLLGTGLRWNELIRAKASDIEAGKLVVEKTKGKKVRRIPLSPELLAECRQHVGKLVPWDRPCSDELNAKVRTQAAIEGFHAHRCRHTYAYAWIEAGGALASLQRVLGHSTIEQTMRYVRADDELVERDAQNVFRVQAGSRMAATISNIASKRTITAAR